MTGQRPDDRSGDGFLRTLQAIRGRLAPEVPIASSSVTPLRWDVRAGLAQDEPEWVATACFDAFALVAVVLREAFLLGKPSFLPRVSWCLSHHSAAGDMQAGGPAPTLENAQARAELALRVGIGVAMDS